MRIARHGDSYGAAVSAQTSESIDESIINPIDIEEIAEVNLTKSTGNIKHKHIQGVDEFTSEWSKM